MIKLHKKSGGVYAVTANKIETVEDITETRRPFTTEVVTVGGCRINGTVEVTETAEEVLALMVSAAIAVHRPGADLHPLLRP